MTSPIQGGRSPRHEYRFGVFRLLPAQRILLEDGAPVRLGSRAMTILMLLVERAGELVSTHDIVARAWPDTVVEENNLRVHVASLRKILRDNGAIGRAIINEPGRGYRFVASVESDLETAVPATPAAQAPASPVPAVPLARVVGREQALLTLFHHFTQTRLLTLVGPGGIGKTTVARQGAQQLSAQFLDGTRFVDLAPLTDPAQVPGALATAMQYVMAPRAALSALIEHLHGSQLLIVLDNCEHVIDGVAELVETLLPACPGLSILATSREALRASGERVQQLQPLETPSAHLAPGAAAAMRYAAVQLFVERAAAAGPGFELTDANAASVCQVCRNLDGLPLALELGASCAVKLGLEVLLLGLEDRLVLLTHGRRTNQRHQTLRAMLDWSYAILTSAESCLLSRLSLFAGWFSLDAAMAVSTDAHAGRPAMLAALAGLVSKSLVSCDTAGQAAQYRLLESTRAYAAEKLQESGLMVHLRERHARFFYDRLADAESQWRNLPRADWWTRYGPQLDDIRAAINWALRAPGQLQFGLQLLVASAPLWLGLSKLEEFHLLLDGVLSRLPLDGPPLYAEEFKLNLLQGVLFMNVDGPSERRARVMNRAVQLARVSGDRNAQLTALWAYCGFCFAFSQHDEMFDSAKSIAEIAAAGSEQETQALADRMIALSHYARGELALAQAAGEKSVGIGAAAGPSFSTVFRYDQTTTSRANLSLVLYLRGDARGAGAMLDEAVADARRARNPNTLAYIMSHIACPLALWLGRHDAAVAHAGLLRETAVENGWPYMREVATWWNFVLTHDAADAPLQLPVGFDGLYALQQDLLITTFAPLVNAGAVARASAGAHHWASAEILRAHGEMQLRRNEAGAHAAAKQAFQRALMIARQQGALAWQVRVSDSLARMGRGPDGDDTSSTGRPPAAQQTRSLC